MPIADHAAQFSAFAALKGYDNAIDETTRITENRIELDEGQNAVLNEKLNIIADNLFSRPTVSVTYFKPDEKKNGGAYQTVTGSVKKIDEYERNLIMTDGSKILFDLIIELKCNLFDKGNL